MTTENQLKPNGYLTTFTLNKLSILDPEPGQVDLDSIAVGLGNKPHFGGQTRQFFSIAEHSLLVAQLVPQRLKSVALLHDAAEAFLGDMLKPIKVLVPEFARIEDNLTRVIFEKWGLNVDDIAEIKWADKEVQCREYDFFFKGQGHMECYPPAKAVEVFYLEARAQLWEAGKMPKYPSRGTFLESWQNSFQKNAKNTLPPSINEQD